MISLYSVFKTRDFTLWTKIHIAEAMVFLVVMYGCDSWTIKKAEWQTIEAFKLWCWRRDLRVLWTARRSIHSVLKELNPKYSLEELILKLKLQFFGHLMWRADSLENILMLVKIEGRNRREWQRTRWMDGITDSVDTSLSSGRWWRSESLGLQRAGHLWATEQQPKKKKEEELTN